jgi:hypothetical protein
VTNYGPDTVSGCPVQMSSWIVLSSSPHILLVLGSPVQSGLLSNIDKTENWTGPRKLTNLEKLDETDINQFSAVF